MEKEMGKADILVRAIQAVEENQDQWDARKSQIKLVLQYKETELQSLQEENERLRGKFELIDTKASIIKMYLKHNKIDYPYFEAEAIGILCQQALKQNESDD